MEKKTIGNALAKQAPIAPKKAPETMIEWIDSQRDAVKQALPSVLTVERFVRIATNALNTTPDLRNCTPMSFIGAMMQAAQLGLEPNTPLGQAYLIPRMNGKTNKKEAQFQIGYHGLLALAQRSGQLKDVYAHVAYANDEFEYELGLEPKLVHRPAMKDRGEPIFFYAVFHTTSGGFGMEVMSVEDIRKHAAKYSDSFRSSFSPWTKSFEEMAKKTVLKRVLKYAPMASDFLRGVAADETIKNKLTDDVLDEPDETVETDFTDETIDPMTGEIKEVAANA